MQILISELLEYSRIGSSNPGVTRLNLKEVVEDVVSDLSVLIADKKGEIEISGLPEIEGSPTQMRQLFQNLIGNSLKYNESEKPSIRITCKPVNSEPFWEIRIEDNGIGFDERYLDKIFKPFHRLHGRNSKYEGTGMGLAICRKIVERHGGGIAAKSEIGKGSVFTVRLPNNFRRSRRSS
jgi:signal transduction histidine kinase